MKKRLSTLTMLISGLALFCTSLVAQEKSENWLGTLDAGVMQLRLNLVIETDAEGNQSAKVVSLDQGNAEMKCDAFTRTDKEISFECKAVRASFTGKISEDGKEVVGTFIQGAELPFTMKRVDKVALPTHIQTWASTLKAGPKEFDFQVRVFDTDGEKTGKLDSFSEKAEGIPIGLEREGTKITIKVPIPGNPATFIGTLNEEMTEIVGEWEQRGGKFPLTWKKVALTATRKLKLNRPQTPKPPFNYDTADLTFENKKDDLKLAGTLTSPKGDGPYATVVLISGSGPQDRDETLFGHKPFMVIADHLTKQGFAVFRYDDRGTAQSTGDFSKATSADFANDVEAIIEGLKSQPKVDAEKIVLCGHSEGGIIAPMVSARNKDVAGIIMMAGPGVDGRAIAINQTRLMSEAASIPEHVIKVNEAMLKSLFELKDGGGFPDATYKVDLGKELMELVPESEKEAFDVEAVMKQGILATNSKWFDFFATYDPAPALEKTTCPVLAIVGAKDTQVDPNLNNPVIEASLEKGGNKDFEVSTLPNLNHLFQDCETGALAEYNQIDHTMSQSALDKISNWLKKRF